MLLSIVAPVYNEEDVIEVVINNWFEILQKDNLHSEIVLADDGSRDSTSAILSRLEKQYKNLKVVTLGRNCGYGKALQNAIKNTTGDYIVSIDSDGQFDLEDFKPLYDKLKVESLDVATGFRKNKRDSMLNIIADRILNLIIRVLFRIRFRDTNCALKVFNGRMLRNISIDAMGYPAPTELLIKLSKQGAKIDEVGITHYQRSGGRSKLKTFKVGLDMLLFLLYLRLKIFLFDRKILNAL